MLLAINNFDAVLHMRMGRWVTRFLVIHGAFDCEEPLTGLSTGWQRRDAGYLGAVHVLIARSRPRPARA